MGCSELFRKSSSCTWNQLSPMRSQKELGRFGTGSSSRLEDLPVQVLLITLRLDTQTSACGRLESTNNPSSPLRSHLQKSKGRLPQGIVIGEKTEDRLNMSYYSTK